VTVRRAATAFATAIVAIVVAFAVPVSQLRTVSTEHHCCCPDPDHCHCPVQKPCHGGESSMRTCHDWSTKTVAPQLPGFTAPAIVEIAAASATFVLPTLLPSVPHAAPAPARPDAPS